VRLIRLRPRMLLLLEGQAAVDPLDHPGVGV
jgi:hypothetical protein